MTVMEKVSYLKGLAEGLGVDDSTKEGKVLKAIIDVLDDMASDLESLEDYTEELTEQVDAIDEDLDSLESDFYEEDEDGCGCEGDDLYDITCPNCEEEFSVDEETLLEGSIECPNCGEKLEFDIEDCDDCEDGACGCGCHHEDEENS
ncbi:MAG TPA: hypothetical protein H9694_02175 [Firmicutes bacterium]|nr:hypothetical protein [Bacillota bacterium]